MPKWPTASYPIHDATGDGLVVHCVRPWRGCGHRVLQRREHQHETLGTGREEHEKAQALFSRVMIAIEAIDGHVPSTTTTTENGPISIFG